MRRWTPDRKIHLELWARICVRVWVRWLSAVILVQHKLHFSSLSLRVPSFFALLYYHLFFLRFSISAKQMNSSSTRAPRRVKHRRWNNLMVVRRRAARMNVDIRWKNQMVNSEGMGLEDAQYKITYQRKAASNLTIWENIGIFLPLWNIFNRFLKKTLKLKAQSRKLGRDVESITFLDPISKIPHLAISYILIYWGGRASA